MLKKTMLKRTMLVLFLTGAMGMLLIGCGKQTETPEVASEEISEEVQEEPSVGMANPWEDCTEAEIQAAFDTCFMVPEGATDVSYQIMNKNELGQMLFTYNNLDFCARLQRTEGITDISGMYYEWTSEEEKPVAGMQGKFMSYSSKEEEAQVLLWLDDYNDLTYCLSVTAPDLSDLDIVTLGLEVYLGQDPLANGEVFVPNDFLQERTERDSFDSFDEMISLLQPGEAYAIIQLKNAKSDLLIISSGAYDNGDGNMATIEGYVYAVSDSGTVNVGNLFSSGTAYPLACDGEIIYTAGNHNYDSYFMREDGTALMVKDSVYEIFDENGNATYGGFLREGNTLEETTDVSEDDAYLLELKIEEYLSQTVIDFTVIK